MDFLILTFKISLKNSYMCHNCYLHTENVFHCLIFYNVLVNDLKQRNTPFISDISPLQS